MATWATTYPGLDAALHELASTLTSSPTVRDDRLEDLADAVRSYYGSEMSGSSFRFEGWSATTQQSQYDDDDPTSEPPGSTTTTTTPRRR